MVKTFENHVSVFSRFLITLCWSHLISRLAKLKDQHLHTSLINNEFTSFHLWDFGDLSFSCKLFFLFLKLWKFNGLAFCTKTFYSQKGLSQLRWGFRMLCTLVVHFSKPKHASCFVWSMKTATNLLKMEPSRFLLLNILSLLSGSCAQHWSFWFGSLIEKPHAKTFLCFSLHSAVVDGGWRSLQLHFSLASIFLVHLVLALFYSGKQC